MKPYIQIIWLVISWYLNTNATEEYAFTFLPNLFTTMLKDIFFSTSKMRATIILSFIFVCNLQVSKQCSPPKTYSSYRPIPLCTPSDYFRYPTSVADVVSIVKEAIAEGKTAKAFGALHSQTDIICTEGIPVSTFGLSGMSLNPNNFVATFGAGVMLRDATEFLRQNGRALKTTPAYGNITIAGAMGTGAHGSTIKHHASISSQVVGLTIVDGTGAVQVISSPEDLRAFRINLGLLGIVTSVDFETHPLYKTTAHNKVVPDSILTDGSLPQLLRYSDQTSLYWFPSFHQVVVANWTIVDVSTPGNAFTYDHVPSSTLFTNTLLSTGGEYLQSLTANPCPQVAALGYAGFRAVERYFQNTLLRDTPLFVPIYTEDGVTVKNPATGFYDLMFAPACREDDAAVYKCVWAHEGFNVTILDNEFTLALSDLPAYVRRVKEILETLPGTFPFQGILLRFAAASDIYMSTAYGRDSVHFEYYLINRHNPHSDPGASLAVFQVMAQVATKLFGARSHWGKSGMVYQSEEMIDRKLDAAAKAAFITKMNQFDPNGVFMNNFGRRLKKTGTKLDVDPEATRCALQDYCFCSLDADCGHFQRCREFPGYPQMKTCRTLNDDKVQQHLSEYQIDSLLNPENQNFSLENIFTAISLRIAEPTTTCEISSALLRS